MTDRKITTETLLQLLDQIDRICTAVTEKSAKLESEEGLALKHKSKKRPFRTSDITDIYEFVTRLWYKTRTAFVTNGGHPSTLVILDDQGVRAIPFACLGWTSPEDMQRMAETLRGNPKIKAVCIVACAETSTKNALLVFGQWRNGDFFGLGGEVFVAGGDATITREFVMATNEVPKTAPFPFPKNNQVIGYC
jgi:hypothetical protein